MEMATSELLTTGDFCMIALYLVVVVTIGILAGRGQKTSEDYFLAGRQMHWFPLALSIWASLTSANSMLGAPSYGYSQDLQYIVPGIITSDTGRGVNNRIYITTAAAIEADNVLHLPGTAFWNRCTMSG